MTGNFFYNKGIEEGQDFYQKKMVSQNSIEKSEESSKGENKVKVKNPYYELFYGEWEATGNIYVDSVLVNGICYSEKEVEEAKEYYNEHLEAKTIQFAQNKMIVNGTDVRDNIYYDMTTFPARNDYQLYFTMKLEDIGLTEEVGKYYTYVEVEEESEDSYYISFFIKDENTIIVFHQNYCVEYRRTSYEGGSQEPIIIIG